MENIGYLLLIGIFIYVFYGPHMGGGKKDDGKGKK